jgi:hypothetical protein
VLDCAGLPVIRRNFLFFDNGDAEEVVVTDVAQVAADVVLEETKTISTRCTNRCSSSGQMKSMNHVAMRASRRQHGPSRRAFMRGLCRNAMNHARAPLFIGPAWLQAMDCQFAMPRLWRRRSLDAKFRHHTCAKKNELAP